MAMRSSPLYLPRLPLRCQLSSCLSPFCALSSRSSLSSSSIHFKRSLVAYTLHVNGQSSGEKMVANGEESSQTSKTFVVTTPLYYVNAAPHMGSAYPTIAADALSRFQKLQGRKVIFITGTDEHGEKIARAAAANGRQPQEHCDIIAEDYRSLWKDLDIAYDSFIRTTNSSHEKNVTEFYRRVFEKGDIYRKDYEGLYCVNCEEFKDEKELIEDKCCPTHQKPCEIRKEDNYFFSLTKYQKSLEDLLSSNSQFVQPSFRVNEVQGWVKDGLRDFSISRAAVDWGIPVPTDHKQTIYVWFDALVGYISALLQTELEPTLENAANAGWPASVHIIGKDILRFHAVYWPAMLMSAGFPLPGTVFGHGFLTKDGLKMGKSLGNTIEPKELVIKFGSDAVRYYFLKEIEFGRDGDYSEEHFINIVNAHLANTIGNLLNRTLGLLKKNCNSLISVDSISLPDDNPVRTAATEAAKKSKDDFSLLRFSSACEAILSIATAGNVYIDERAPWSLFKQGGANADIAAQDLVAVLEGVRIVAVALSPITPQLSLKIYLQLGYSEMDFQLLSWEDTRWGGIKGGQLMGEAKPVFKRIEDEIERASPKTGNQNAVQKKQKRAKEEAKLTA